MYDERKPSEGGSSASVQGVDRKDKTNCAELDSVCSENAELPEQSGGRLPPGHYRQGYCSCCQVHYINLEKHLSSDQHRQISLCKRNRFRTSMLMERFLQDVNLYHPQNYHDTRPTYDDIPEVDTLSSSQEDPFCILLPSQTQTMATASNVVTDNKHCIFDSCPSKRKITKKAFTQACNKKLEMEQCSSSELLASNSKQTIGQESLGTAANTLPHSSSFNPTLFSSKQLVGKNINCFETPQTILSVGSNKRNTNCGNRIKCAHHNVTTSPISALKNRQFHFRGSYNLTSGSSFGKESIFIFQDRKEDILRDRVMDNNFPGTEMVGGGSNHFKNKGICLFKVSTNSVDDTIEAVIQKYCNDSTSNCSPEQDDNPVLSLKSDSEGSSLSFDWNVPMQLREDRSKVLMTNLDLLKESSVQIDEDYKSKLKCVLSASTETDVKALKSEPIEEIIPALSHVPPSFVGKTWSQIMYEDDLKVEALVKQFKKGKFHCYFEEGPPHETGSKGKPKNNEPEKKAEVNDWKEYQNANVLPFLDDNLCDDHYSDTRSIKSERVFRLKHTKPCRRTWRQASRCQVVKVSHGTQTSLINYPVIKKKVSKNESSVFDDFGEEMTPEMKTRMCALKLPESYTKILTPLQPKNTVYVLSHPDIKPGICKAAFISGRGRNRYSTDSRDSVFYKYKQSPLKYYDPLTNRILKTPPRNSRAMVSKASCVRKLFRSLSSEGNVDKLEFEPKKSGTSKKSLSSGSVTSLHTEFAKGKDVNSCTNGGGSSGSTDYIGAACVKAGHADKSHAHFSLSACNVSGSHVNEDMQHSSIKGQSIKTLRPKRMIKREPTKSSTKKTKPIVEPRVPSQSKDNPHRMVKNLRKVSNGKSKCKKQPRRKCASVLPKSTKSFVQICRPSKKIGTAQRNEQYVGEQEPHIKSQFISLKPAKRKSSMIRCVSHSNAQNSYQDKIMTRTRSKTSEIVHNTIHHLRSRLISTATASSSRIISNTRRGKVR